ncbi:MAG: hypothetical protein ACI841_000214 [Planctomycetota bacterium]|jgi:hypothetical protein
MRSTKLELTLYLCVALGSIGATACRSTRSSSQEGPLVVVLDTSVRSYAMPRARVAELLQESIIATGWAEPEFDRPALGAWVLRSHGEVETRFFSMMGSRRKRLDIEARLTSTATGRSRVELELIRWVSTELKEPADPDSLSAPTAASFGGEGTTLRAKSEKVTVFEELERRMRLFQIEGERELDS